MSIGVGQSTNLSPSVDPHSAFYFTYHEVEPEDRGYLYQVTTSLLDQHAALASRSSKGKVPVINFDDGHASNFHHAAPVLEKHGVKAIFFVTAGWTESRPEYMTFAQLRELERLGHSVQSHSWSHPMLTHCQDSELRHELEHSRKTLEDRVGCAVDEISMPGGRWNERVVRAAGECGYKRVYLSDPWSPPRSMHGVELLPRLIVWKTMSAESMQRHLELTPGQIARKRAMYNGKDLVKKVVGDRIYHALWKRVTGQAQYEGNADTRVH
jgi:peptidoglycan/xylan/chitin deacetylase (PgdA/CDA1 family)